MNKRGDSAKENGTDTWEPLWGFRALTANEFVVLLPAQGDNFNIKTE